MLKQEPRQTRLSRRGFVTAAAVSTAAMLLPHHAAATTSMGPSNGRNSPKEEAKTIRAKHGTSIFYKEWGAGQPIVFSHGWPLTADAWDSQMLYFGQRGYRVIAHDRRSHGRSDQTWDGNEMDTYADDLAALFDTLELHDAIMVGHSTGGGEVARYLGRHGSKRVAKAS